MLDRCRKIVACAVACSVLALGGLPLAAGPDASFVGKVLEPDGVSPRSGVVVTLVDGDSRDTYRSRPTDDEGTFRVEGAPAGTYSVLAETEEGAYLAAKEVTLEAGANRPVSLTLKGAAPNYQTTAQAGGGGLPSWAKWTIVGGIVVGSVFVINEVTKDEEASSPF